MASYAWACMSFLAPSHCASGMSARGLGAAAATSFGDFGFWDQSKGRPNTMTPLTSAQIVLNLFMYAPNFLKIICRILHGELLVSMKRLRELLRGCVLYRSGRALDGEHSPVIFLRLAAISSGVG